ncbi:MAG: AAA family ATPase, partial [Myxococcales bacterium]|nr:AAA family ATPase [Myxococcales bacterium]
IIHRDVKPSNVLVETQSNAVVLADFGISKLLEDEKHHLHEPEVFTGTLPYLSPEQSGRTARPVDYRSDLYSLGVSFYELLSGRLPFERSSPLELLHAHLARRPTPLQERRADLPAQLSAMVMKLLEKAPERRYQTARGLLADLEQLAAALAGGSGEPDFPLGRRDRSPKLHFARLYGRDREQAILEQALARLSGTAAGKTLQLITIEGEAGLGKSALIRQLEAPVLAAGGYLALGSHSESGGPHSGLVAAFEALFQQVLTEDDQSLATWRRRLRGALGALAPVIAALVPSAELVLGELEPARVLEPAEARNRLTLAISRLVTSVAAIAPLVLVIEDVQLADAASRELMTALMAEADTPALLLLSLRPSPEVEAWLEKHLPTKASRLRLQPLTEAQLHALLADTLDRAPEDLAELAALVGRKTGNNPWLIQQFLVHLEALRLLEADADGWRWDPAKLAELSLPEGLVGVLEARLALLPADARRLLCQAAHIGPSFDLELLAAVAELEDEPLFAALRTLESAGVIDRRPGGYRFADLELLHVARDFADQGESRALHARIGAEILGRHDIEEGALGGEWLFEAADHLEAGDPAAVAAVIGRKQLARLNFAAGQRAFDGADWDTARRYFAAAYDRLKPEVTTASTGGLSMSAAVATGLRLAQSLTLIGDHEDAKTLFETLEGWQLSEDEAAELVARRVQSELLSGHYQQAMARGLAALRRQGIEIPERISKLDIGIEVFRRWRDIHEVSREDWLARPMADDVGTINLSRLIAAIKSVAYLADKPLFVLLSGIHVRVAAGPALDELGALALAELAISVAFGLRKPEAAAVLCEHALALCERPAMAPTRPRIEAAALLFIWPCSRPWRRYVDRLPQLVDRLSEGGNRQLGGFAAVIGISQLWISGQPLSRVLEQGREWSTLVSRWGTPEVTLGCAKTLRLVELLIGERTSFDELIDSEQGRAVEASPIFGPTTVMCRMIAAVLLGEPQRVYDELDTIVDDFEQILFGSWQAPRLAMWAALVDASRLEAGCDAGMRRRLRARLRRYEALVSRWARSGPENFGAMLELIRAERAQVRGRVGRAQAGYERAREHARTQRNPMLEGLASLRLAELAERSGQPVLAHGARALAVQAFRRWGAKAVVERLERELAVADDSATFGGESTIDDGSGRQPMLTTATTSNANLDLSTVLEVVTSIGEALDFGEVVGRVLAGAVSHAGADRGLLLLEQDGAVRVIADERADEGADDQSRAVAIGTILADYRDDRGTELAPTSAVNYVLRTGTTLILDDARSESRFAGDPYMQSSGVCSLLCMPIIKQGERVGALLLENHLATHAFTRERLAVLQAIVAQAAGALENARL